MTIIKWILCSIGISLLFYALSRLQMKAWLEEIDSFLSKKVMDHLKNDKKENYDNKEEK